MVLPQDERRHPGAVEESWLFTFVGGAVSGYAELVLRPAERSVSYVCALVGAGPLLSLVEHDLAAPRTDALEVRGEGIWSAFECEQALEHWSVGLEAFAVALEDPADAWGDAWGDRTGIGLDLGWEATGDPFVPGDGTYRIDATVTGEVLVGGGGGPVQSFALDAVPGRWTHHWGPPLTLPEAWPPGSSVVARAPFLTHDGRRIDRALLDPDGWRDRLAP